IRLRRVRALAARRITGAGVVALILGGADDGVGARAAAALAGVGLRAGVAVVVGGAVGLRRVRAEAARRITGAGVVALILGGADDGVGARAAAALAGVGLRAGVAVVAGGAVGLRRIRAEAARRIARPGVVALILGGADDGVRAGAAAALAGVGLRAAVAVIAGGAVGLGRIRALAAGGIAGADVVALVLGGADDGVRARAGAALAGVALRAGVAVVAGDPVRDRRVLTSRDRVARVGGARVAVVARRRVRQRVRDHEVGLRAAAVGVLPVAQDKLFPGSVLHGVLHQPAGVGRGAGDEGSHVGRDVPLEEHVVHRSRGNRVRRRGDEISAGARPEGGAVAPVPRDAQLGPARCHAVDLVDPRAVVGFFEADLQRGGVDRRAGRDRRQIELNYPAADLADPGLHVHVRVGPVVRVRTVLC